MDSQNCLAFFIGFCLPVASFLGYQTYQSYLTFRKDVQNLKNNLAALNGLTYLNGLMGVASSVITIFANLDEHLKTRQAVRSNRVLEQFMHRPRPGGVEAAVNDD